MLYRVYINGVKRSAAQVLLGTLTAFLLPLAGAQPGPPDGRPRGPPGDRGPDFAIFEVGPVLRAAQAQLASLRTVAVFEHVHGKRGEKREVRVLLGNADEAYGAFHLNPESLEPVPVGLEGLTPRLGAGADPRDFFRAAESLLPRLSVSSVVVPEKGGYKLLLVYDGRVVGELRLDERYVPDPEEGWLEEFEESSWHYPDAPP